MKQAGIRFQQSGNAFRRCSDPEALLTAGLLTSEVVSAKRLVL
jgi:hypothetical protein